jgi:hypothetical protein
MKHGKIVVKHESSGIWKKADVIYCKVNSLEGSLEKHRNLSEGRHFSAGIRTGCLQNDLPALLQYILTSLSFKHLNTRKLLVISN